MKFTVIGSRGYIGSKLAAFLRKQGHKVFEPMKGEMPDPTLDLGSIVYCAGLTNDFGKRIFDTVEAHVSYLSRLFVTANFQSVTYLSSTRLYDSNPHPGSSEADDLHLNPNNPRHIYDLSKAMGEAIVLGLGERRGRVARLSCVYSADEDAGGFLPSLVRDVAACIRDSKPTLSVETSPAFERDYVFVEDVVSALGLLAMGEHGGIFNVASGENTANDAIFRMLNNQTGVDIIPALSGGAPHTGAISIERMQSTFSWSPTSVECGLQQMLRKHAT